MENDLILNVDNDIHIFCLHYVFIHYVFILRINHAISQFIDAWNVHPLSSMNNMSPIQLWIAGVATLYSNEENIIEVL